MSTAVLLDSPEPAARATLEWRLLQPFTALLLMLIAVPLAHMRPRQGRYARLVPAILVYLVYFNLLGVGRIWASQSGWGSRIGLWWVPAAALVFGLVLLKLRFGTRRVRGAGARHAD